MLEQVKLDDFQIGDSQNPPLNTIYFAKPKNRSIYPKDVYAIKILTFKNASSFQQNEKQLKQFYQYVRIAYVLKPDFYSKSETQLFIFMEKMTDLASLIQNRAKKEKRYTPKELKDFLKHTSLALEELEKKNFPHKNLKPSNILQNAKGEYKLTDTGLISMNEDNDFKAPELMIYQKNPNIDYHKSDVFSLGLILLQMVTLRSSQELQAFKNNGSGALRDVEEIFTDIKQTYGRPFQKILKDMLLLSDSGRKTISQMREELEDYYVIIYIYLFKT